jgi:glutamate N-acetyltransferase/amino-acid N-acetyltransferase
MASGQPLAFDRPAASQYLHACAAGAYLQDDTVAIRLQLGEGTGEGVAWGCDLSAQYVRINADYTT